MFVKMCAVKKGQTVAVAREVRGGPIKNYADAFLMAAVDQELEIAGRAKTAGDREIADCLIAPRAIERVLHDRHHLDVRVAPLLDVGNKLLGKLAIGEPAAVFVTAP
jgi:hypothetical protein